MGRGLSSLHFQCVCRRGWGVRFPEKALQLVN